MNSRPSKISKRQLADLVEIVRSPSLREVFEDQMRSMLDLPLAPYHLAQLLRLIGYHEIRKMALADEDFPILIDRLQQLLGKSGDELLEILRSLKVGEEPLAPIQRLRVLNAYAPCREPRTAPASRVPSFHDPPGS